MIDAIIQENAVTPPYKLTALHTLTLGDLPEGSVAEVGVYRGGTARLLAKSFPQRTCYLFDTFEGMPFQGAGDFHRVGEFYCSIEHVRQVLHDCPNALCVKGIFPDTANVVSEERFAFVYLDGDQYQTTKDALEFFWPRMNPGGIIALDDYRWPMCPGVESALLEFGQKVHNPVPYFAYLVK